MLIEVDLDLDPYARDNFDVVISYLKLRKQRHDAKDKSSTYFAKAHEYMHKLNEVIIRRGLSDQLTFLIAQQDEMFLKNAANG